MKFKNKLSDNKLLLIPVLLSFSISANAGTSYKTNLVYPNLSNGTTFGLVSNNSHKLQFYTGMQDGKYVGGYYRAQHFLGWIDHKFAPLDVYNTNAPKGISSVVSGPANNTIVLSYVEGVGHIFSNSADGKNWATQQLAGASNLFDTLVNTNPFGIERVIAYGKSYQTLFTTNNSSNWYQWNMPTGCNGAANCVFENKYLGDVANNYVLLQSATPDGVKSNSLYYTTNLQNWYIKTVPFASENIQKVFKGGHNTISAITMDANNISKLWITQDLDTWGSFDLPANAKVTDLTVNNNNKVELLLMYKTDGEQSVVTTEHVSLDEESKTFTLLHRFNGAVANLNYMDDKVYFSGDFTNDEDSNHAMLVSASV